ncbi:MAG: class I SAM-dependent methyltransferase, partial [Acidobacteriota bacterium]
YFVQLGCEVHVDDYVANLLARSPGRPTSEIKPGRKHAKTRRIGPTAQKDDPRPASRVPLRDHESGVFQAVLCWDLFDYVRHEDLRAIGQEISRVTAPGGFIFALFGPPVSGSEIRSPQRFRLRSDGLAEAKDVGRSKVRPLHLPNREIVKIFHQFDTARTVLLRNGTREMLFHKRRSTSLKSAPAVPAPI